MIVILFYTYVFLTFFTQQDFPLYYGCLQVFTYSVMEVCESFYHHQK